MSTVTYKSGGFVALDYDSHIRVTKSSRLKWFAYKLLLSMRKSTCCSARIEINMVGVRAGWVTDKLSWHPSTPSVVIAGSKIDAKPGLLNSSTDSDQPNTFQVHRSSYSQPTLSNQLSFLNLTAFGSLDIHVCKCRNESCYGAGIIGSIIIYNVSTHGPFDIIDSYLARFILLDQAI